MKASGFKILKVFSILVSAVVVLAIIFIAPIDETPLQEQPFYKQTKSVLDTLSLNTYASKAVTRVGWATVNITPDFPMPMAGYRLRDHHESVHDSLYARVLVIDNGATTVGIVSVDLLMFPSSILLPVQERAQQNGFSFIYAGATHTHNGVGGWEESIGGQLVEGDFNNEWVNATIDKITNALMRANTSKLEATLAYGESNAQALVANRLKLSPLTDGKLRAIRIQRSDSTSGLFYTFSAHATMINKKSTALSSDYPGVVNALLKKQGYSFSMYLAGMVASHRTKYLNDYSQIKDFPLIDVYSKELARRLNYIRYVSVEDSLRIQTASMPIAFGPSQMRIARDLRIRPWVFASMFGPLQGNLTLLRLGSLALVGAPCDFSGELFNQYFQNSKDPVVITSFNGGYVGYITEDSKYTTSNRTEVRNMNWVGPYYGQYLSELMLGLLDKK